MMVKALEMLNREGLREDAPVFSIGDAVRVHVRIVEGDKQRVQVFSGTVIARDGDGAGETFTVRRVTYGVGVEKVFPVHTQNIEKIEVERHAHVRRAKLYYLRDLAGKKARLRERKRRS